MDWVYETLIVGCLAYAGAIVIDYVNYRDGITPRIQRIERGVVDIRLDFVSEEEAAEKARSRVHRLRTVVDELRRQKTSFYSRLVCERDRKQKLEMAVFRKRLKRKEPLSSA